MAIEDELSNDIAIALLIGKEIEPGKLNNLKEVVLKIHASLRQTTQRPYRNRPSSNAGEENKKGESLA
jgi:hypothetical protein